MDDLDRKLIRLLQNNARSSFTDIARELSQPDTTIHFRTRRMVKNGIISRFCALIRPEALDYRAAALLRIRIGGHILPEISRERAVTFAKEMAAKEQYLWVGVGEEPMTIYACIMGKNADDIETRINALRRSPDVADVTVTGIKQVVKGWEVSMIT